MRAVEEGKPVSARFGRFELEGELGRGGQGVVFLAHDPDTRRPVALKVLHATAGLEPDRLERFRREARASARFQVEGLCTVYEAGEQAGQPYLAMEYVAGGTLARSLARERESAARTDVDRQRLDQRLELVETLARAVDVAHQGGVVHRDIKPANVLLRRDGRPVLTDFGVASLREPGVTRSLGAHLVGTPAYMAPEQVAPVFGQPDARTDVYALGALLYECLTLRTPFEAPTRWQLFEQILWSEPQLRLPRAPRDLPRVLRTALAKEPRHRYASALELAEDLARLREGGAVRGRPPGVLVRVRRAARRRPGLAAALALFVLAGLAAILLGWMRTVELRRSIAEEELRLDLARVPELVAEVDADLWPALAPGVARMERWLAEAEGLLARRSRHEERARETGAPILGGLEELEGAIETVRARRSLARARHERSVTSRARSWASCSAAVAGHPAYRGLQLAPRSGLVPLGQDPRSGLFEFAHVATGEVPRRDPSTGALEVGPQTALVLVLIPAGEFEMGADPLDVGLGPLDVQRTPRWDESPVQRVRLRAFFLSKYEMTRGQWQRSFGMKQFSEVPPGLVGDIDVRAYPATSISWNEAARNLGQVGLGLPTEAQWEYAARAGTRSPWWTGEHPESLAGSELLRTEATPPWAEWLLPVGTLAPNPFGLHDVHGSVAELVRERWLPYTNPVEGPEAERTGAGSDLSLTRGGAFVSRPGEARASIRNETPPEHGGVQGLRPAMALRP